jgi:Osmosensitive K+ channel His kinase sensor domain
MLHGNIYPEAKVSQALTNFFRTDNLTALRELALRGPGRGTRYRQRRDPACGPPPGHREATRARHRRRRALARDPGRRSGPGHHRFAQQHQITQIVIGSSQRSRWQQLTGGGSNVTRVIREADPLGIDVHVIALRKTAQGKPAQLP